LAVLHCSTRRIMNFKENFNKEIHCVYLPGVESTRTYSIQKVCSNPPTILILPNVRTLKHPRFPVNPSAWRWRQKQPPTQTPQETTISISSLAKYVLSQWLKFSRPLAPTDLHSMPARSHTVVILNENNFKCFFTLHCILWRSQKVWGRGRETVQTCLVHDPCTSTGPCSQTQTLLKYLYWLEYSVLVSLCLVSTRIKLKEKNPHSKNVT
jgi:hypothetical protein